MMINKPKKTFKTNVKNHSEIRSRIITGAIAIENLISVAITQHYFNKINNEFLVEVMNDEYFNFGLKIKILIKCYPEEIDAKLEHKIRRLFNIRNIIAHCNLRINNGKEWVIINPAEFKKGVKNVRKYGDGVDFEKLDKEFKKLFDELLDTFKKLIPSIKLN